MKVCKAVAGLVLGLCLCALLPGAVQAEENPLEISVGVGYMYGFMGYETEYTAQVKYVPGLPNYDDCETSEENGFAHAHFSDGFPFATYNWRLMQWDIVTADMSDQYWDVEYNVSPWGWHRVSGSTLARNCHGYSTGRNYWVLDIGTIVTDEWKRIEDDMPKASCIKPTWWHSWKVPEIYVLTPPIPPGFFKRSEQVRIEKAGSGGVYTMTWEFAGERVDAPYYEHK